MAAATGMLRQLLLFASRTTEMMDELSRLCIECNDRISNLSMRTVDVRSRLDDLLLLMNERDRSPNQHFDQNMPDQNSKNSYKIFPGYLTSAFFTKKTCPPFIQRSYERCLPRPPLWRIDSILDEVRKRNLLLKQKHSNDDTANINTQSTIFETIPCMQAYSHPFFLFSSLLPRKKSDR